MNKRQINYDSDKMVTAQRLKEAMNAETMQKANRDKMERLYFGRKSERENFRSDRKEG
jgi:hypothetical protein